MAKKEVLIINSDTAAASAFEAAKFGYAKDGATFTAALTSGDDNVSLFYGSKNVGPISEGNIKKVTSIAYSAGTAQSSTATVALESGSAYVKIINTTKGTMNLPIKTFEGASAAIIEGLMDVEFAKSSSEFYGFGASISGAVITITAPIDSHFRLAGNDASSFVYGTAAVPSVGTEAKVAQAELGGFIDGGVFGLGGTNIKKPVSVVSGNYDLVLIEAEKVTPSKAVGNAKNYDSFIIEVYVKDGNSTVTPAAIVTEVEKLK